MSDIFEFEWADSFTSSITKDEYKINHCSNCNEKCMILLLTCTVCLKQYVGQTLDEFRLRWNKYKSNSRNHWRLELYLKEHLFEHFNDEGHHKCFEDISTSFIDRTDSSETFKRENYWKSLLKTMASLGLRIEAIKCLKNIFRNHRLYVLQQNLWITVVVIIIYYLR